MSIKSVKIKGFKTFAEGVEIRLSHRLTAVVGPNGSGKSNLVDAVRWGIGEHTARLLRISNPTDIIFAGFGVRKPLGMAEVAISLDNREGKYPIEQPLVQIIRRCYRDGENEYLINDTKCRLKDIEDLFRGTGLGKQTYSVVGQGEVEQVISATPAERLKVLEELAGVDVLRTTKRSVESKLDQAKIQMEKISAHVSESEYQYENLARQAEVLEKYQILTDRLGHLKLQLHLVDLRENVFESNSLESKSKVLELKRKETQAEIDKLEEVEDFSSKLDELEKERSAALATRENAIVNSTRATAQLEHMRANLATAQETLRNSTLEEESLKRREKQLIYDLSQLEEEIEKRSTHLAQCEKELEDIEKTRPELTDFKKERQNIQTKLDQSKRQADDARSRLQEMQSRLVLLAERKRQTQSRTRELEEVTFPQTQDDRNLDRELEETRITRSKLEGQLASFADNTQKIQGELMSVQAEKTQTTKEIEKLKKILDGMAFKPSKLGKPVLSKIADLGEFSKDDADLARSQLDWIIASKDDLLEVAKKLPPNSGATITIDNKTVSISENVMEALEKNTDIVVSKDGFICLGGTYFLQFGEKTGEAQIETQIQFSAENLDRLSEKETSLETSLKEAREKQKLAQQEMVGLSKKELELSNQMAALKAKKEAEARQAEAKASELAKLAESFTQYEKEMATCEKDKEDFAEKLRACVEEARANGAKLSEFDAMRLRIQEEQVGFERRLAGTRETKMQAQKDLEDSQREKEKLVSEFDHGKTRLLKLSESTTQAEKDARELETGIIEAERELNTAKMTILHTENIEKQIQKSKGEILEEQEKRQNQTKNVRARLARYNNDLHQIELSQVELKVRREDLLSKIAELGGKPSDPIDDCDIEETKTELSITAQKLAQYGAVNMAAKDEAIKAKERVDFLNGQLSDLAQTEANLRSSLSEVETRIKKTFEETYRSVESHFRTLADVLFAGAIGNLRRITGENGQIEGIEVEFILPGRKLKTLHALSGGEKTLAALALLFAFFKTKSSPFCVLDEVDAALDDSNIERFTRLLRNEAEQTQFVVITHNKETMRWCDALYGITLDTTGTSRVVSVKLDGVENS
ncbi:MAG TPA: AAA family ATPase [Caldisericia bacterium]|nr:MAG: Chromosome partition protein Smc [bacterium ADurb.Bin132]HNY62042.1 AAA family ATPase [Caldisericia bacterium]HOC80162.1 AAA family ATPase [Caldisericia bacterium]HOG71121.1 AAA family ATPase [Caldisericia bacterium]HPA66167.1 AAA family ATPase [Caldisericia bacterium]